jgi:ABC-type multidrug transport system ATPase subunit
MQIVGLFPEFSARETGMIVIASIHQPNYELLQLFDNLLLLAKGRMVYSDKTGSSILILAVSSY